MFWNHSLCRAVWAPRSREPCCGIHLSPHPAPALFRPQRKRGGHLTKICAGDGQQLCRWDQLIQGSRPEHGRQEKDKAGHPRRCCEQEGQAPVQFRRKTENAPRVTGRIGTGHKAAPSQTGGSTVASLRRRQPSQGRRCSLRNTNEWACHSLGAQALHRSRRGQATAGAGSLAPESLANGQEPFG